MGGITAQGTGAAGNLWLVNNFGFRLYKVTQSGGALTSPFMDSHVGEIDAIAFNKDDGLLYTASIPPTAMTRSLNGRRPGAASGGSTWRTVGRRSRACVA